MTEKLYYIDAYMTEFSATVLSCEEYKKCYKVVLDKTCFYPEGGGQPGDTGTIGGVYVTDTHEKDDIIYHYTDAPLTAGEVVGGKINWLHRFDLMQNHSGEHILSGIICAKYGCDNVGFHMGKEIITIDFNAKIPEEDLVWLEEKANEAIWLNAPVGIRYPSKEELEAIDYRSKKALEGEVRIVNVGNYDCCACCGTHVKHAGEIGQIKIISIQSYKGGTRMEILCGMRALVDYRKKNSISYYVGSMLSSPALKTGEAVAKLVEERDNLNVAFANLKNKYFESKLSTINAEENILLFGDDLNSKDMTYLADKLIKKGAVRVAVFTEGTYGCSFVLISSEKDAKIYADEMKEYLGLKGGGKNESIQGRVEGDKIAVKEYFKTKGFSIYE